MNFGFRLCYYKEIPQEDVGKCLKYLHEIEGLFNTEESYKVGYSKSGSLFRRGNFGVIVDEPENKYCFRRLIKNRRIFGVVPISLLEGKNGPINLKQCSCGEHRAGQKVKLKIRFNENDYITVFEVGKIKG